MVKVGLMGIGLDTYWGQFKGLKERLIGYQQSIKKRMEQPGVTVVDAGLVDNPVKAHHTADIFQKEQIEILFLYISTYALSHTILPVLQRVGVPVIILNVQPVAAIDYEKFNALGDRGAMTGEWLAHCQACSVPEIANVCNRIGLKYDIVTGYLTEDYVWRQLRSWISAATVRREMRNSRIGILGHYYCGMLDVYTDVTQLAGIFGCHFELLEMDELALYRREVTQPSLAEKREQFDKEFSVSPECDEKELDRAALTSCALDRLIKAHDLQAMAYYYEGSPAGEHENIVTSVIAGNTLLTAHHVPVAGECEVKNVVAMKIMDLLHAGGSFSELYALDFTDDIVMWGHDGPAHPAIAEGTVSLVPLPVYHGKPGKGLSIQMSVRNGPVTLFAVVQGADGKTFLLTAEGECVDGPVLHIGNTNSRYRFPIHAREFVDKWSKAGPSHHCSIGIGHISDVIEKIAFLLGIDCVKIC